MKKFVVPLIMVLGGLDALYGVITGDRVSVFVGAAIVVIGVYILKTKK